MGVLFLDKGLPLIKLIERAQAEPYGVDRGGTRVVGFGSLCCLRRDVTWVVAGCPGEFLISSTQDMNGNPALRKGGPV